MEDKKLQTLFTFLGEQKQIADACVNRFENHKKIMNRYRYSMAIDWARGELSDDETYYSNNISEVEAINWFINNLPRSLDSMDKDEVLKLLVEGVAISEIEAMNEEKWNHVQAEISSEIVESE